MYKLTVLALVMTLIGCTSVPDRSYVTPEIPTLERPQNKLPPISRNLLIPCFDDLMPVEAKTDSIKDILDADATTFSRVQQCYLRQYNLINEVLRREGTDN